MSTVLAFTLRSYRVTAGLSQNRLAALAGINPAYVNRMEKGHPSWQHPSRDVIDQLARAMRLDDHQAGTLAVAAGYWPWSLSPDDTRLLLDIGDRIAQAPHGDRRPHHDRLHRADLGG